MDSASNRTAFAALREGAHWSGTGDQSLSTVATESIQHLLQLDPLMLQLEQQELDQEQVELSPFVTIFNSSNLLLLFTFLVLINLVVIFGNILVILAVFSTAKLRNVTNIFIVSLATADLLLGIFVLPYALMFEVLDVWIFGELWCRGWLVTDVWISTASILNLCAISVDRYVAVTRPVKYRSIMTPRRAKTIVAGVWIVSFLICFPPLLFQWNPSTSLSSGPSSLEPFEPSLSQLADLKINAHLASPSSWRPPPWQASTKPARVSSKKNDSLRDVKDGVATATTTTSTTANNGPLPTLSRGRRQSPALVGPLARLLWESDSKVARRPPTSSIEPARADERSAWRSARDDDRPANNNSPIVVLLVDNSSNNHCNNNIGHPNKAADRTELVNKKISAPIRVIDCKQQQQESLTTSGFKVVSDRGQLGAGLRSAKSTSSHASRWLKLNSPGASESMGLKATRSLEGGYGTEAMTSSWLLKTQSGNFNSPGARLIIVLQPGAGEQPKWTAAHKRRMQSLMKSSFRNDDKRDSAAKLMQRNDANKEDPPSHKSNSMNKGNQQSLLLQSAFLLLGPSVGHTLRNFMGNGETYERILWATLKSAKLSTGCLDIIEWTEANFTTFNQPAMVKHSYSPDNTKISSFTADQMQLLVSQLDARLSSSESDHLRSVVRKGSQFQVANFTCRRPIESGASQNSAELLFVHCWPRLLLDEEKTGAQEHNQERPPTAGGHLRCNNRLCRRLMASREPDVWSLMADYCKARACRPAGRDRSTDHRRLKRATAEPPIDLPGQTDQIAAKTKARPPRGAKAGCRLFDNKPYVIYSSLGSFYIPMLIMLFFYSRIYLVASRSQRALQRGYMTTKWPTKSSGNGAGSLLGAGARNGQEQVTLRIHRREKPPVQQEPEESTSLIERAVHRESSTETKKQSLGADKLLFGEHLNSAQFELCSPPVAKTSQDQSGQLSEAWAKSRVCTCKTRSHCARHQKRRQHQCHHHLASRADGEQLAGDKHHHRRHKHHQRAKEPEVEQVLPEAEESSKPVLLDAKSSMNSVQITVSQYDEDSEPTVAPANLVDRSRSVDIVVSGETGATAPSDLWARSDRSQSCAPAPSIVVNWNAESGSVQSELLQRATAEPLEGKLEQQEHTGSQTSGLSLMANLPSQVRKQSMMLLSSITSGSRQTLRRLSMVAINPMGSFLSRSKSRESQSSSSQGSTGPLSADACNSANGWRQRHGQRPRGRRRPKRTFDDYLMAVAGIDTDSSLDEDESSGLEDEQAPDQSASPESGQADGSSGAEFSLLSGLRPQPLLNSAAAILQAGSEEQEATLEADDENLVKPVDEQRAPTQTESRLSPGLHRQGGYYERATSRLSGQLSDSTKLVAPRTKALPEDMLTVRNFSGGSLAKVTGPKGPRMRAKRTSRWHAKRLKAETKAAKTVAIIVGGFIFCWLPFFSTYLSRAILCEPTDCVPESLLSVFTWLGYLNSAINPVIYGLFSADFRHAFKSILCRCAFKQSNGLQPQDDTVVVSALVDSIIRSIM